MSESKAQATNCATASACKAYLDRLDATGLTISLANLPKVCQEQYAAESSAHLNLQRRSTLKRLAANIDTVMEVL